MSFVDKKLSLEVNIFRNGFNKAFGLQGNVSDSINAGFKVFEKIQAVQLPWWHAWRVADKLGKMP